MPKDVDTATLSHLLDLQEEDSAIKRLTARRESLPEAGRLAELDAQLAELDSDLSIATTQAEEIARGQARIEDEMKMLEDKLGREEQRLFSGAVSNPKELSALQAEVEMLKRRRAEGEDALLEAMVTRDQSTETTARLGSEHRELTASTTELRATVDRITSEIDDELAHHEKKRAEIAGDLPTDLVELYERLRDQKGGVGAAALVGGTCQGCHTQLPNKEVERLRAEGGLQRCDNCRRILVVV